MAKELRDWQSRHYNAGQHDQSNGPRKPPALAAGIAGANF